jgi:alpha/beta superfamily hydrolase
MVFYSPPRKERAEDDFDLPPEDIYVPHHPKMIEWTKLARATPHRKVEIKTFDGLTLRGRYYELTPDAPIEIMMHGYRGCLERDLSGGIFRALDAGHSVLVYDHRGSGFSDGTCLTFGINESKDCRRWIDFVINEINKDAKIILSGVSMGGATAMITSGYDDLPENMAEIMRQSIQKVMDEKADIVLGNHPFQNNTLGKRQQMIEKSQTNPFIDPDEWRSFLLELDDQVRDFIEQGY